MTEMFQPKDENICDNCFEMTADYGANGADGTLVYICERCKEEGTYENVEFEDEEEDF
jgi:hypothetical protein